MENEIKENEFVRTKDGVIDKVIIDYKGKCNNPNCNRKHISCEKNYYNEDEIVKHSLNLKNLIQKDDFVNGDRVVAVDYTEDENGNYVDVLGIMEIDDDYAYPIELRVINIREVITKEQFESISYKVKE